MTESKEPAHTIRSNKTDASTKLTNIVEMVSSIHMIIPGVTDPKILSFNVAFEPLADVHVGILTFNVAD